MRKRKELSEMTNNEFRLYCPKVLKKAKILSLALLGGIGVFLFSSIFTIVSSWSAKNAKNEFLNSHGYDFDAYKKQVISEQEGVLQSQVLAGELSFEEYESKKAGIKTPTETEWKKTWPKEHQNEYQKLDNKTRYSFGATIMAGVGTSALGVVGDRATEERKKVFHEWNKRSRENRIFSEWPGRNNEKQ